MKHRYLRLLLPAVLCLAAPPLRAQEIVSSSAQGININLVNVDLRSAVQLLSAHVDRPVFFGAVAEHRITFTSPRPVPPSEVAGLLRQLVAEYGYVMEDVEGAYRIRSAAPAAPPQQQVPQFPQQPPGGGSLAAGSNGMELFVIRLRHARAADVAATVNALYGRASAVGELGQQRRGTLNDELNDNRVAPYGQEPQQVATGGRNGSGNFNSDVVIVPDFRTNSLLVRASRGDFELVRAAVEQVDVRPLQVLIEATVAYVSRDFNFAYGVQAGADNVAIPGSHNTVVEGSTVGGGAAGLVIRALNLGGIDLDLILRAGETRSNVIILDRPLLLAANNQEAEINVGEQRPFVQVQRSTDGGVLDEVVQYKDVGTRLAVRPTISADGFVQLQVTQEVNSAQRDAGALNAPIITTRSVTTELLVRDGHTAVLGGLANHQRERTSGGIPFLSSLPIIGGVFGNRLRDDSEFELFIFITPHVIDSDEAMDDAADDIRQDRRNMRRALRKEPPMITPASPDGEPRPATPTVPAQPAPISPQP